MQGEFRGDFTRDTFNQAKHFLRVLKQQGRVDVEADFNEQTSILLHYLQSLAADLVGQHGGPGINTGFAILDSTVLSQDFQITQGHYYVDGILCELESPSFPITLNSDDTISLQDISIQDVQFKSDESVELFDPIVAPFPPLLKTITKTGENSFKLLPKTPTLSAGATHPEIRHAITYTSQPDYPLPIVEALEAGKTYLVYLDVWERNLTYLQDGVSSNPGMREVALGGPDTATRSRIICQVKVTTEQPTISGTTTKNVLDNHWQQFIGTNFQSTNRGLLKARVQPTQNPTDCCTISPKSSYRGTENQLYRLEIHAGGKIADKPTFKWSRENGSVIFPMLSLSGSEVALGTLGRDSHLSLQPDDWVEFMDDSLSLNCQPGIMAQVDTINRDTIVVTLKNLARDLPAFDSSRHPILRRWDQRQDDSNQIGAVKLNLKTASNSQGDNAARIVQITSGDDAWLRLENGIEIQFQPGATYRTGDYWLIPARVATGDIEWPRLLDMQGNLVLDSDKPIPLSLPPHGVEHHYAPLARIVLSSTGTITQVTPLRRIIGSITKP